MTQVVTVHTDFTDVNQMTQGLVGRVNDSQVILPAKDPVNVGEWVQFAVTLYDGSPAFAGVGRCINFYDNGEDRLPHQRFDVVFDSLQFDSRAQQIYQHILALSGVAVENQTEGTGSFVDISAEVASASSIPAAVDDAEAQETEGEGEATVVAGDGELREAISRSALNAIESEDFGGIDRDDQPTHPPATSYQNGQPRPINGATFSYPEGLPFPDKPPRPELDPSLRVTPAPAPVATPRASAAQEAPEP